MPRKINLFFDAHRIELLHIHRQSAYLIGRDRLVADIAIDHPSSSKQHAAIQCMLSSLSSWLITNFYFRSSRSRKG